MASQTIDKVKKFFLVSMITLFVLAGIFGAVFFLIGSFNDIAVKIFLTIGVLFLYSLLGLASARILQQNSYLRYLAVVGLVFSTVALILIMPVIWNVWDMSENVGKATAIASFWAFSIAHLSLISGKMKNTYTKISYFVTMFLIVAVAGLLTFWVIGEINENWFWRIVGFFGVLDVSGTIVTPLMRRLKG